MSWCCITCDVDTFDKIGKGRPSPYLIAGRRVPELIPVLGSQPAGGVSHNYYYY